MTIDCRWWKRGGAGRVTELLLQGLMELEPTGSWNLWGPDEVARFTWNQTQHIPNHRSPKAWWGQRDLLAVPDVDVTLFMHQIRPLRPSSSTTVIYDTIPLHFGSRRWAKAAFLKLVVAGSRRILTFSEHSKRSIVDDLGVDRKMIKVLRVPVDNVLAERISRSPTSRDPFILYVGRFAEHKNLPRLITAFSRSRFRKDGGRLVLAGGSSEEVLRFAGMTAHDARIELRGYVHQGELEDLYRRTTVLVLPSLEEGFGLPAWEALVGGVPVCISDAPALVEATFGLIEPFPATSVDAMTSAIDRIAFDPPDTRGLAREAIGRAPTTKEFANEVVSELVLRH